MTLRTHQQVLIGTFLLLVAGLAFLTRNAGAADEPHEAKPPRMGIAPSHIVEAPAELFEQAERWQPVADRIDLYKYYGVQLIETQWATRLDPKALVESAKAHSYSIGCEFGDFHLSNGREAEAAIAATVRQVQPIFDAGGTVDSLHLDGPIRRLLKNVEGKDNGLTLEQCADVMVEYFRLCRQRWPKMKIGLITNLPNWDYTAELRGFNGDWSRDGGFTYLQVLETVHRALTEAGDRIDFVEIDCPYNYYRETRTRRRDAAVNNPEKMRQFQKWLRERGIAFHFVVNCEPRSGPHEFEAGTLTYVDALHRDGVRPDVLIIQSWYEQPRLHLGSDDEPGFMSTAAQALQRIDELYGKRQP